MATSRTSTSVRVKRRRSSQRQRRLGFTDGSAVRHAAERVTAGHLFADDDCAGKHAVDQILGARRSPRRSADSSLPDRQRSGRARSCGGLRSEAGGQVWAALIADSAGRWVGDERSRADAAWAAAIGVCSFSVRTWRTTATVLVRRLHGVAELRRVGEQVRRFGKRVADDPSSRLAPLVLQVAHIATVCGLSKPAADIGLVRPELVGQRPELDRLLASRSRRRLRRFAVSETVVPTPSAMMSATRSRTTA
jgi:hypothetical protein